MMHKYSYSVIKTPTKDRKSFYSDNRKKW